MEQIKVIGTASEMSNLVGMYAFLIEDHKIKAKVFITGKAYNTFFICQAFSAITGEANVAKLLTLEQLKDWVIIPTKDLANEIIKEYAKNGWVVHGGRLFF